MHFRIQTAVDDADARCFPGGAGTSSGLPDENSTGAYLGIRPAYPRNGTGWKADTGKCLKHRKQRMKIPSEVMRRPAWKRNSWRTSQSSAHAGALEADADVKSMPAGKPIAGGLLYRRYWKKQTKAQRIFRPHMMHITCNEEGCSRPHVLPAFNLVTVVDKD